VHLAKKKKKEIDQFSFIEGKRDNLLKGKKGGSRSRGEVRLRGEDLEKTFLKKGGTFPVML